MNPRYAILLDGGFVTKALASRLKTFPTAQQVIAETLRIRNLPILDGNDLLRIYFYDAPPATGVITNPISGSQVDLPRSPVHLRGTALLNQLEQAPDFAVRKGETVARGWKIGDRALKNMLKAPRIPTHQDLVPNVQQKGVDLRIGLDIASLAHRQLVQTIVVVTADSDLIPAFKLARREGLRVYLDHLSLPVRMELKAHTDLVL
jgi:uncharacterized LabA/DUF88 family protein